MSRTRSVFGPRPPEAAVSLPNAITLLRLLGSLALFALAALRGREIYNFAGLAVHFVGDVLDGWTARTFRQETILGAKMDIVSDRVETLAFFANLLRFHPALTGPVLAYAFEFAVLDLYLSWQFRRFGLISINYFHRVDRPVYDWNFSPAGKAANSAVVPLSLVVVPAIWPAALTWTAGLAGVKIASIARLRRIAREPSAAEPRISS